MQLGQGYALWVGIGMIIAGTGIFLWSLCRLMRAKWPEQRWEHAYYLVLSCYPLGVGCKSALAGSEFLRFHLSDIGFPAFLALMLFQQVWRGYARGNKRLADLRWTEQRLVYLRFRKNTLVVALVLSTLYEVATGMLWAAIGTQPELVGNFDWWDMASYSAGFGFAFFALERWRGVMESLDEHSKAEEAEAQRNAQQQRRSDNRGRRKKRATNQPRRRRGGRI